MSIHYEQYTERPTEVANSLLWQRVIVRYTIRMTLESKPPRKRGPIAGPKTEKYTLLLEPELAEWAKQQPGGLSAQVRRFLRAAYAQEAVQKPSSEQPLTLEERRAFLRLPLAERRRILAEQAESLQAHYEEDTEWREFQGGDIVEY